MSNAAFDIYFNGASQMCSIFMQPQAQLSLAHESPRGALFTSATTSSFLFLPSYHHKNPSILKSPRKSWLAPPPLPQYDMDRVFQQWEFSVISMLIREREKEMEMRDTVL